MRMSALKEIKKDKVRVARAYNRKVRLSGGWISMENNFTTWNKGH
jgi:hypothetical protein